MVLIDYVAAALMQAVRLPDEVIDVVAGHLSSIRDLVAMSMVSRQFWAVVTNHPTTITTPVYTRQARARAAWRHLPWGMDAGRMACVRRVATGHSYGGIWKVVVVGEWVATCSQDGAFKVWEQQEWTCLKTVNAAQGSLLSMAECGGMLATGGRDGRIPGGPETLGIPYFPFRISPMFLLSFRMFPLHFPYFPTLFPSNWLWKWLQRDLGWGV